MSLKSHLRALTIQALRTGWTYQRMLRQLNETQYYSKARLTEYKNQKLRRMILHCYKNVPYYRETFQRLGLTPDDIRTTDDLQKLPFIDKHIVRENFEKFVSTKGIKSLAFPGYTSGSTGMPCKFLRDYHFINFENASIWRHFITHGYNPGMRRLVFTGRAIVPPEQKEPPFWIFDTMQNTLVFSSLHLAPENEPYFLEELARFKPQVLAGYPSMLNMLAEMKERHGLDLPPVTVVFPGSETVFDHQRENIERAFETSIHDWYGQQERVAAIGQCEFKTYHIIEDYSVTELVDTDGHTEIVGTHLENYKMPLLRYRTGDTVKKADIDCPCGRHFRTVDRVLGRMGQYILTPDGRKITVVNYLMQHFENVREAQFVQNRKDALILNLAVANEFSEENKQRIIETSRNFISPSMDIQVQIVDAIPRTREGKFMCVVNNLIKAELN